ncbi:hypothetical protein Q5P01_017860 [Channa striata]|uniref:C-type lectin domain-containing protein n=1 Tax=Channa striata TaxID=64152 RepID=A0AA88MCC6_CHASR|nr:hypothetical protein Q5P01_017860 [Channa striata]
MILSGLCFLPSCFSHSYFYIKSGIPWADAQQFCRSKYTDLATIQNQKEVDKLGSTLNTWRWSLENQSYYGKGGAGFRNWAAGEPHEGANYQVCVLMTSSGQWADELCTSKLPFICYKGSQITSPDFILVNDLKTWTEAQLYCRDNYTDLASVRNQAENDEMKMMLTQNTWIGLHRNSWKWSDGSVNSFSYWYPGAPVPTTTATCIGAYYGKWYNFNCNYQFFFLCFEAHIIRKVVQVKLKKTDSVEMEDLKDDLLQKFSQTLKDRSLDDYVRLTWVKRSDGKMFEKKNTEKLNETCPLRL